MFSLTLLCCCVFVICLFQLLLCIWCFTDVNFMFADLLHTLLGSTLFQRWPFLLVYLIYFLFKLFVCYWVRSFILLSIIFAPIFALCDPFCCIYLIGTFTRSHRFTYQRNVWHCFNAVFTNSLHDSDFHIWLVLLLLHYYLLGLFNVWLGLIWHLPVSCACYLCVEL